MPEAEFSLTGPTLLRAIERFLVPFVLAILWVYAFFVLPGKAAKAKIAARYASLAGLIIFVLFVISRKGKSDVLTLGIPTYYLVLNIGDTSCGKE
jgi:hypothetical protein